MSIPYVPKSTTYKFRIPKTLESTFDRFLEHDIPDTVMNFELLHDWYDQFDETYEPNYIRGEIYPDATKSRYENMDNYMNFRASRSSGIRQGDMVRDPNGEIYLMDWQVYKQSDNSPTRLARCNMHMTVRRHMPEEVDDRGFLIHEEYDAVIVDDLPCNGYRYDGRPEFNITSGRPGISADALSVIECQVNDSTKNILIDDKFVWGRETYIIVDIDMVGVSLDGNTGTYRMQCKKDAGGFV